MVLSGGPRPTRIGDSWGVVAVGGNGVSGLLNREGPRTGVGLDDHVPGVEPSGGLGTIGPHFFFGPVTPLGRGGKDEKPKTEEGEESFITPTRDTDEGSLDTRGLRNPRDLKESPVSERVRYSPVDHCFGRVFP